MATELIACPRCGANPTHPPNASGQYVCGYCGSHFWAQQPMPRPVQPAPLARPLPKPASGARVAWALVGLLLLLCGVGGVTAMLRNQAEHTDAPSSPLAPPTVLAVPALPEVPATATFTADGRASGYQTSFYVLGFVKNTSPFTIDKPKVTAVLLDAAGKEIATRDGYAEGDSLAAGASAPIKVLVSDPPAHASIKYELVAKKADYLSPAAQGLRVEVTEAPHKTFGTSYEATGKVFNDGKANARFVNVQVLAFDAKNKLVGLDSTYVDGEAIAPGASGRFRAMTLYDAPPHHFQFVVAGRAP